MQYVVYTYDDDSMKIIINNSELSKNGYSIKELFEPNTRDHTLSRLLGQLCQEDGLVLSHIGLINVTGNKNSITLDISSEVGAYFDDYYVEPEDEEAQEQLSEALSEALSNILDREQAAQMQKSERTIFRVKMRNMDKAIEICHALKEHRVKVRDSVLYKIEREVNTSNYTLLFITPESNRCTINAILEEFMPDEISCKYYGGHEMAFYNEHYQKILDDAVPKLAKI